MFSDSTAHSWQALDSIKISTCIHFGSIISYLGKSEAHHQYKPWGATLLATEIELTGQLKRETYENSICLSIEQTCDLGNQIYRLSELHRKSMN